MQLAGSPADRRSVAGQPALFGVLIVTTLFAAGTRRGLYRQTSRWSSRWRIDDELAYDRLLGQDPRPSSRRTTSTPNATALGAAGGGHRFAVLAAFGQLVTIVDAVVFLSRRRTVRVAGSPPGVAPHPRWSAPQLWQTLSVRTSGRRRSWSPRRGPGSCLSRAMLGGHRRRRRPRPTCWPTETLVKIAGVCPGGAGCRGRCSDGVVGGALGAVALTVGIGLLFLKASTVGGGTPHGVTGGAARGTISRIRGRQPSGRWRASWGVYGTPKRQPSAAREPGGTCHARPKRKYHDSRYSYPWPALASRAAIVLTSGCAGPAVKTSRDKMAPAADHQAGLVRDPPRRARGPTTHADGRMPLPAPTGCRTSHLGRGSSATSWPVAGVEAVRQTIRARAARSGSPRPAKILDAETIPATPTPTRPTRRSTPTPSSTPWPATRPVTAVLLSCQYGEAAEDMVVAYGRSASGRPEDRSASMSRGISLEAVRPGRRRRAGSTPATCSPAAPPRRRTRSTRSAASTCSAARPSRSPARPAFSSHTRADRP